MIDNPINKVVLEGLGELLQKQLGEGALGGVVVENLTGSRF